ncbi:hypothetical protein BC828DRAFT_405794 [Blastocladiella britannica]|nr:hypothetical protein BC828DRAFT_405794 [Blastocladiella britannica]
MADFMRKMIAEMMGEEALDGATQQSYSWDDSRVCRGFLENICLAELFVNTKLDRGECKKVHSSKLRADYEAAKARGGDVRIIEADLEREFSALVNDCDRRIRIANERVAAEAGTQKIDVLQRDIEQSNARITEMETESEKLGEEGEVEKAMEIVAKIEEVKKERAEKEAELRTMTMHEGNSSSRMCVCDVCGAYLHAAEPSDKRVADHFTGKMHVGYDRVRALLRELRDRLHRPNRSASGSNAAPRNGSAQRNPPLAPNAALASASSAAAARGSISPDRGPTRSRRGGGGRGISRSRSRERAYYGGGGSRSPRDYDAAAAPSAGRGGYDSRDRGDYRDSRDRYGSSSSRESYRRGRSPDWHRSGSGSRSGRGGDDGSRDSPLVAGAGGASTSSVASSSAPERGEYEESRRDRGSDRDYRSDRGDRGDRGDRDRYGSSSSSSRYASNNYGRDDRRRGGSDRDRAGSSDRYIPGAAAAATTHRIGAAGDIVASHPLESRLLSAAARGTPTISVPVSPTSPSKRGPGDKEDGEL